MFNLILAVIYLAFISLGLPDSLLGAAWPSVYPEMDVPVSYAGIISFIIAVGTVVSTLNSEWLTKKFGTGKVTAVSAALSAAALLGFSLSRSFIMLCLCAVPYGLGAGSVDASLNNYAALHYSSKHMSWLHCMWGVGTVAGPYVIGFGLARGFGWSFGYKCVFAVQLILTVLLFLSLPLWKKPSAGLSEGEDSSGAEPVPLRKVIKIPGAKEVMTAFFCYCALEQTTMLWASSYMVLHNGISAERAANYASLFFIGITVGRAINGFLTVKFTDDGLIRLGQGIIGLGIVLMLLPLGNAVTLAGILLIGLGCAPIYPCIIHSTPEHFGAENSQALVSVQIASAYLGICVMPPLFGLIAKNISAALLPVYLTAILVLMIVMHELLVKKTAAKEMR